MPRGSACSYYDCGQDLLAVGRSLSKPQKNHIAAYHTNRPITFICRHTDRPTTFNRQSAKGMDFVCYCGSTFTLNSSLQRHYQLCMVARDTALNALTTMTQVDIPVPGPEEALPLRPSNSSGGTSTSSGGTSTSSGGTSTSSGGTSTSSGGTSTSSGGTIDSRVPTSTALADPTIGRLLEEKMVERHQIFLETFTEHTTAQHTKFMVSMTECHMTFLEAFTTAQVQQNINLQSALADQHRMAFEQQRDYLDLQRRTQEELLSEQKRDYLDLQRRTQEELLSEQKLTRDTVRNFLSTKRDRSFTLEVDEQALKKIQNDPAYIIRST